MKLFNATLIICISLFSCAQKNENSKNITTEKSEKHINIPGTKLFMIPPIGFEVSKSLIGLQKGDNYLIQIYDLDGGNFYSNAKNVSKKAFEDQGMKVLEYSEFQLNGYPVKYIHVKGLNNIMSHQFIFGDSTFSVMAIGAYPIGQEEMGKKIKASIFTMFYDKNSIVDPMATALFSVNQSKSKFKFYKSVSNVFMYSVEGKKDTDRFSPMVLISQLPMDQNTTFEGVSEILINGLEQNGFTMKNVESKEMKKVNGKDAYEKIFNGYLNGQNVKVYYLIFMTSNQYITFTGLCYSDNENNLKEFKKLSETLKIK